jgi:ATP-binding cassette subfamily B protein
VGEYSTGSRGFRSFLRLLTMLRPFRSRVISSAIIAFLVAGAQMLVPYFTGRIIDLLQHHRYGAIDRDLWLLIGAAAIGAGLNASRRLVAGSISLGLEKTLRERLFEHLSGLSFTFLDRNQTGQLLSRVTVDVTQVRFFLGYGLTYFFMHITKLVAVPIAIAFISPTLAVVALVMMPLIFLVSRRYSRLSHPVMKDVQQREADATAAAEENIIGARVVRAFGQEHNEVERYRGLADRIVEKEREMMVLQARYQPLYSLITNAALAAVILLGAVLIHSHNMTIGGLFSFYGYMLLLTGPVRIVGNLLSRAQRATASGERLWELLDNQDRLPVAAGTTPLPKGGGEIRFEGVTFEYHTGARAVSDVTLTVPVGSTVALLGPTGCGKTTLASLVPRFYDPSQGRVLVDGVDVRELDPHELRRAVGLVNQEPFLFSDTVAANLRFGAPDASDDELWAALDSAQAADFVRALPNGLNTLIGERGFTLSGGQRQRVAIARALLVDPTILILDDATASVDSRVESRITGALHTATRGRTTILIAHRPSTIALADHIVIMDRGRIADQGTHDELIGRSDAYRQIHEQRAARREFLLAPDPVGADEPGLEPDPGAGATGGGR